MVLNLFIKYFCISSGKSKDDKRGVIIDEKDGLYLGKKPDFYVDEILRYEYLNLSDRRKLSIVSNEDNFYDVDVYKQKLDLFVDEFFSNFSLSSCGRFKITLTTHLKILFEEYFYKEEFENVKEKFLKILYSYFNNFASYLKNSENNFHEHFKTIDYFLQEYPLGKLILNIEEF